MQMAVFWVVASYSLKKVYEDLEVPAACNIMTMHEYGGRTHL
jgi:hypothetical protein